MYVGPIENEFGALIMENKEMANNLIGMFATAFITGDKGSIPEIVVNWDWKREKNQENYIHGSRGTGETVGSMG